MTPYTSILALESEAAYYQMGIPRTKSKLRGVRLSALGEVEEQRLAMRLSAGPPPAVAFGCSKSEDRPQVTRCEQRERGARARARRRRAPGPGRGQAPRTTRKAAPAPAPGQEGSLANPNQAKPRGRRTGATVRPGGTQSASAGGDGEASRQAACRAVARSPTRAASAARARRQRTGARRRRVRATRAVVKRGQAKPGKGSGQGRSTADRKPMLGGKPSRRAAAAPRRWRWRCAATWRSGRWR